MKSGAMALALLAAATRAHAGPPVDAPGKLPDTAATVQTAAYDSRLLSSYAAAQQFQGALDGGWTLSAEAQGDLYGLQITEARGELGGAWRDLRRKGGPGASGFLDEVRRGPGEVVIRFAPQPGDSAVVTLRADGQTLHGELDQGGRRTPVTLRKTAL